MGHFGIVLFVLGILSCTTSPDLDSAALAQDYAQLGQGFYQSGDLPRAIDFLSRAYELTPGDLGSGYNLARALIENRQVSQGVSLLETLLTDSPQNILLIEALAYGYQLGGRDSEALDLLVTFRDSLGRVGTYNLLLAYYRAGLFVDGARAVVDIPQDWLLTDSKLSAIAAVLRGQAGEIAEAQAILEELDLGQDGFFLSFLADLYQKQERTIEEVALRERLFRLPYRASTQALELARRYYFVLQDPDQGFTWLRTSLEDRKILWVDLEQEFLPVLGPLQVQELRGQDSVN